MIASVVLPVNPRAINMVQPTPVHSCPHKPPLTVNCLHDRAAACVQEQVQPIFDSVTPPGMDLSFAKLQFGDAPIRVEAVRMDRGRTDGVYLEFDVRWAGDPEVKLKAGVPGCDHQCVCNARYTAHAQVAARLLQSQLFQLVPDSPQVRRSCYHNICMCRAQMQPKVDHIRAVATVGVHLKPLVNEVPAFGAAIITLTKPPKLSYNIDVGTIGGKLAGGGVEQFLDNLLPGIIEGFLVWPERIVVPILGEDVTGPITDLMLRHKGIVKVCLCCPACLRGRVHVCTATATPSSATAARAAANARSAMRPPRVRHAHTSAARLRLAVCVSLSEHGDVPQAGVEAVQVAVLEARDIPRMDRMGTSDPSVTIFTDPHRKVSTATKKNTLNPKWDNEEFYLMVQVRALC